MKKIIDFLKFKKSGKIKFILGMVVGVGIGIVIGGYFIAYAEQFIDSFLDTSRVANTWNVEVDTTNGEVKLAQRSCDNTVWFCDMAWRCPGTAGDGSQLLVKRSDDFKQWKIHNNACDTPECGTDGVQAGDMLSSDNTIDFSAYYPARQACKAVGGRLPTTAEIQCVLTYRSSFGNNFNTSYYQWTSEEGSNTSNARCVNTYYNRLEECTKTNNNYVRCVRGW